MSSWEVLAVCIWFPLLRKERSPVWVLARGELPSNLRFKFIRRVFLPFVFLCPLKVRLTLVFEELVDELGVGVDGVELYSLALHQFLNVFVDFLSLFIVED